MKRVLVAGAAGFIGSNLCKRLLEDGCQVIGVDNLSTGQRANVEMLSAYENFLFEERDIIFGIEAEVDEIYNLACPASPKFYQLEPVETLKTNFIGALNLLELAKQCHAKILQASTSEIYGDPEMHPQPEHYAGNVNPIGPRACYDEGKRCVEALFFDHMRQYGTQIKVVRIFNTYGPHQSHCDGRVIPNFITQCMLGKPITIYGDGNQTRSFCYITDLVDGLLAMMGSGDTFKGPVNLGNPVEYTINELADLIGKTMGSEVTVEYHKLPIDDPRVRMPDIALAKEALDWVPKVDLKSGLSETIKYFKESAFITEVYS
jgi:UDP-glucuronate decarboxylase